MNSREGSLDYDPYFDQSALEDIEDAVDACPLQAISIVNDD